MWWFFVTFVPMKQSVTIANTGDLDRAAKEFLSKIGGSTLVAFYAPMGAGKTTFTTAVCRALGVPQEEISSPTFAIVNEYRTRSGEPVFHFWRHLGACLIFSSLNTNNTANLANSVLSLHKA